MTNAERLAMQLITTPMTLTEIANFLGLSKSGAKTTIAVMRSQVLPDLGAWCPRATYDHGYVYAVYDKEPNSDGTAITERGAEIMLADNKARLQTMLLTAEPYANTLDGRTRMGKEAWVVAKAATAALAALDLIE